VQLIAGVLEHVGQPLPAIGRLQRHPAFPLDAPEQRQERLRVVENPPRQQLRAVVVDHGDVRTLAVQVDADRMHPWASPGPGFECAPEA
jgi:hypothetical protein